MWESGDTTMTNATDYHSQLSFYEYPPHRPFINSTYQPLRPSHTLSRTVTLPASNRDQLLTALQSLSLKIKVLENERERAESNLREIKGNFHHSRIFPEDSYHHFKETKENFHRLQDQHNKILHLMEERRPRKSRLERQNKQDNRSCDTTTTTNSDRRHFHLNMNTVPFILGSSTSPSHNVKSNVQNVIALLKNHNHQLCLSSKEYSELLHSHLKCDLSNDKYFHPDQTTKSSLRRPSSASPIRHSTTTRRSHSTSRRPQSATISDRQCHLRMKRLRQEFAMLAREHIKLDKCRANARELQIINRRMEIILDELQRLQRQLKISVKKLSSKDQMETEKNETPLEILRKTRLLQMILTDQDRKHSHRERFNSND